MYKKVEWLLTNSGEKEIDAAGADKALIADRLLKVVNSESFPYKEVVSGIYKGKSCPHVLVIRQEVTGIYVTYMGFTGYVIAKGDILEILDIQDMFDGMTVFQIREVKACTPEAAFDIRAAIEKDPRVKAQKEAFV